MKETVVVQYGGGVNSAALCVLLAERGIVPKLILMADPGDEWPETHAHREQVMNPWLRAHGLPEVTVTSRKVEARYRPRAEMYDTLMESCVRNKTLPSAAYGFSGCSDKYKRTVALWYTERQAWAQEVWARGERLVKAIGYDTDEPGRIRTFFNDAKENERYVPWYPLFEAGLTRDDCEELLRARGIAPPRKSACRRCPNNSIEDWIEFKARDPEEFAKAVEMSKNAVIESPDVVGLMRCNPHGKRQLHLWNGERIGAREPDAMPCDCAL